MLITSMVYARSTGSALSTQMDEVHTNLRRESLVVESSDGTKM